MANNAACETDSNTTGKTGEQFATDWLCKQGYTIIARNFRCKYGELDIVARDNNAIAFIEVKTRKTDYFALSEVVVPSKQRKIIATAKWYLMHNTAAANLVYRFDIALVQGEHPDYKISYIKNAFTEREF